MTTFVPRAEFARDRVKLDVRSSWDAALTRSPFVNRRKPISSRRLPARGDVSPHTFALAPPARGDARRSPSSLPRIPFLYASGRRVSDTVAGAAEHRRLGRGHRVRGSPT